MQTNVHLNFSGACDEAFTFYESVFGTTRTPTMRWKDAPPEVKTPPEAGNLVMHTSLVVGSMTLMGADTLPGTGKPIGGFDLSVDDEDEATVRRLFAALSEGGRVTMPLQATFWTTMFGMCTDKFGVGWMVSQPGPDLYA